MSTTTTFSQWCILEIFGHVRLAGLVSEQVIAGQGFIRVDVPETTKQPAFSKLYGAGAIYSMSPVTEEVARACAVNFSAPPLDSWDARAMIAKLPKPEAEPGAWASGEDPSDDNEPFDGARPDDDSGEE